jgi:hypothetical protein
MTTENRVINVRGVVDDILAGGVEILVHRTTSCGLAAVAQETGQTNIHFSEVYTGAERCAILPTPSRRRAFQGGSREFCFFEKNRPERLPRQEFRQSEGPPASRTTDFFKVFRL